MNHRRLLMAWALCLAVAPAGAQTIQAGIYGVDASTVSVRAEVTGGPITDLPFSNVVVTLFWETASGLTLGTPSGPFSIGKAGVVSTEGAFSYQKFASTPNVNVTWGDGDGVELFTIPVSGTSGPALIELRNPADAGANGDWYIEIAGMDRTNHAVPFTAQSTELPLPVSLTHFAGAMAQNGTGVVLQWATASELNNYGYTVQRKPEGDPAFTDLTRGFVAGHGTTLEPQSYTFLDADALPAGRYGYRLKQQDLNGSVQYSPTITVQIALTDVAEAAPREFQLLQNYPNPFNPTTRLKFSVPVTGPASMTVFTMLGEVAGVVFEGVAEAGRYYVVEFDGAGLASGVYFYRLVTDQKTDVRRMLLVR